MSQHDLILDNASGAAFRADANNALAALGSSMKGPNAPPSPLAGMVWVDDDTPSATIWTVKQYDGADWIELGRLDITANLYIPSEGVPVQRQTVSVATGAVDFVLQSGLHAFEIAFDQVRLTTDGASLWLRGSTDGGATFLAAAQYVNAATYNNNTTTAVGFSDVAVNRALLTGSSDNGISDVTLDGRYRFTVGSAARRAIFIGQSSVFDNNLSVPLAWNGTCWIAAGSSINAIRLLASSGNIASGTFTLTGIR